MLAYRKVSLPHKYEPPTVPTYLSTEIERLNSALVEERSNYDTALYKLTVGIRFLRDFEVKEGGLVEKATEVETEEKATIEADLRESVFDFKKRIHSQFPNDSQQESKIVLQEITSRIGWLRLGSPLKDSVNLKLSGLRDGATIMVWEGNEVAGINLEGPPITVDVLYFYGNEEPIEFQVVLPEQSTIKKLKEAVSIKSEIPEEDMSLCRVGAQEVVKLQLADSTLLPVAQISDKSTITVEHLTADGSSFAMNHLNKLIEVFILDETSGTRSTSPISVRIEKDSTVLVLKTKSLQVIKKDIALDKCRIRRTQSLMQPGTVIGNEKNTLAAVGIQGGTLLILELGEVKNSDSLAIRFSVDQTGYSRVPYNITVPKRTSVAECKSKILELLESTVPASNSRLRKTDAFDSASDILYDETRTLEEMGIHHDDLLVLEIGKSASKGAIALHAYLFLPPSQSNSKTTQATSTVSETESDQVVPTSKLEIGGISKSLADELANGLATALTNSPVLKKPLTPSSPSLPADFSTLIQGDLIPASLLTPLSSPGPSSLQSPSRPSILSAIPPSLFSASFVPSSLSSTPDTSTPTTPTTPTLVGPDSGASSTTISPSSSYITESTVSESVSSSITSVSESTSSSSSFSSPLTAPDTPIPVSVLSHLTSDKESETSENSNIDVAAYSPALSAQYSMTKRRANSGNVRLGDLDVDYAKTTVDELKRMLHALDMLSSVPTHQHLRVWFKEKLLKNNSFVLKKYNITYDAPIVVQTLNTPDLEDTTLLYIHKIIPQASNSSSTSSSSSSSTSTATSSSTSFTPPIEIFVPLLQTTSMLRDYVARALDIPKESVAMAKYAVTNKVAQWKVMTNDDEDASSRNEEIPNLRKEEGELLPPVLGPHSLEASRRGRHSLRRAHAGNSNRVMVKDGDVVGVIDTRSCPEGLHYFKKCPPTSASHYRPSPLATSSYSSSSSSSPSRSSKPRAPEAVLKINLDWN